MIDDGEAQNEDEDGATSTQMLQTYNVSNRSRADENSPSSSDGPEEHVNVEAFEMRRQPSNWREEGVPVVPTRFGGFSYGIEGFRVEKHAVGMEDGPIWSHRGSCFFESWDGPDSMKNEAHSSDDGTVITSEVTSVHDGMSPGPGIGAWAEDDRVDGYHFLVGPLRLTP